MRFDEVFSFICEVKPDSEDEQFLKYACFVKYFPTFSLFPGVYAHAMEIIVININC